MAKKHYIVRNKDGIWVNTKYFRSAAEHYQKHGYYNADPTNSPGWIDFWNKERNKAIDGVEIGGVKITGDMYFYLNYVPMLKAEVKGSSARKIKGFPDFRDGDYTYFWVREIARNGVFSAMKAPKRKKLMKLKEEDIDAYWKELQEQYDNLRLMVEIDSPEYLEGGKFDLGVGKSRRQGYSYKASGIASKNWSLLPNSLTLLVAYNYDYLLKGGLYTKTRDNISFLREATAWGHPSDVVDSSSKGVIRASYYETLDGRKIEKGFKSEIRSVTFNSNIDATRGADAYDVFFEEAGASGTPGRLHNTLAATRPVVMAGSLKTGLITVFGTAGDNDSGAADYGEILLKPKSFNMMAFKNTWDGGDEYNNAVGFFHPVNWTMEGFYDEQGNSDVEGAKKYELNIRKQMKEGGATSTIMQKRLAEMPLTPIEAFGTTSFNIFPILELRKQLRKVQANNLFRLKGTPVHMYYKNGKLQVDPVLDDSCIPIDSYKKEKAVIDKKGCPVIYEFPVKNAPRNSYKIGYDPVAQDEGTSFGAIIVYKSVIQGSSTHDIIVAEYIGRPELAQDIDRIAEMFSELYNSQIMHENMDKGTRTYFRRIKKLHLLAAQPDAVINNSIKNSKVARVYGCHMNVQLKNAGERYIQEWLLSPLDYDEHGNVIHAYDRIYSPRLLDELINYNKNGNFDLVMSLMMALFMVQEQELNPDSTDRATNIRLNEIRDLLEDETDEIEEDIEFDINNIF